MIRRPSYIWRETTGVYHMRQLLVLFMLLTAPLYAEQVPQSQAQISLSFAPLVKEASPAVVNIFANRVIEQRVSPFRGNPLFDEMFEQFAQPRPRIQNSLGSGVILSEDGIVVSNYHVVGMATEIRVVLKDRREFQAEVLLADEEADLAILKIDAGAPLPWLPLRDSDEVEVGELVLAIGNPFGIGQTVSSGIISGLARSGIATGNARGYFIQTDAAINPGNSGGALIDINGDLVGINTSIFTRSGGSNGVGFAIPANLVAQFVAQAKDGKKRFQRPWAGINGQSVTSDLAEAFGLTIPDGVVISSMHAESPFAQAGLKLGHVVYSVGGQPVNSPAEMLFRMSIRRVGEEVLVHYIDPTIGGSLSTNVPLIVAPETPPREAVALTSGTLAGLSVSNINPAVQTELGLTNASQGVAVTAVPAGLGRLGLRPGDVLTAINGDPVTSTQDVAVAGELKNRSWRIDGLRGTRRFSYRFRS